MSFIVAFRNLSHEKNKLLMQVFGIGVSLTLIALLIGFRDGMYASLTAYLDNMDADLVVSQSGVKGLFSSNSAIPATLHDKLAALPEVEAIDHIFIADIIFTHNSAKTPVLMAGYNIETGIGGPWNIGEGRTIQSDDEILLDTWLAHRSQIEVGDQITVLGQTFTVVGLTRETSSWMSPYIFVSHPAAERLLQTEDVVSFYLLKLRDGVDQQAISKRIEADHGGIEVFTPNELAAADRKILATIMDTPINIILLISTVIGIAVMGLITYIASKDEMPEYGILRAVGASSVWLRSLIGFETVYRTLLGFIVGTIFAVGVAQVIMWQWPQFTVVIQLQTVAIVGALALAMTLMTALFTIQRAASVDPTVVFSA